MINYILYLFVFQFLKKNSLNVKSGFFLLGGRGEGSNTALGIKLFLFTVYIFTPKSKGYQVTKNEQVVV